MAKDENELERLKAEIAQEKQMKEMLEESMKELQITVDELDKRMDSLDDENNEWKTRYESQLEINQQLQKQAFLFQDKVDDARKTFKDSRHPKTSRHIPEELKVEVSPQNLKQLQRDKYSLDSQLRDMEWKLDQESKAYHKANEERKHCLIEINSTKDAINDMKHKQKRVVTSQSEGLKFHSPSRPTGTNNLRQDQRILDPRKGPIKKTAAVRTLPRLQDV